MWFWGEVIFWRFYRYDFTNRSYTTSHSPVAEQEPTPVGKWGYLFGLLELSGFLAGGIALLIILAQSRYCDSCQKYFANILIGRTSSDEVAMQTKENLEGGHENLLKSNLLEWAKNVKGKSNRVFSVSLKFCKGCYQNSIAKIHYQNAGNSSTHDFANGPVSENLTRQLLGKAN